MVHGFPGIRARLQALAAAVPRGSRVADVGSDHGHLPRLLVASGRTDWCVATEFAAGPTRRLRQGLNGTPEADRIEVRRGDGLEVLCRNDRIDVLVMSGMGGVKMLRILDPRRLDELHIERLDIALPQGTIKSAINFKLSENDNSDLLWTSMLLALEADAKFEIPAAIADMAMMMSPQAGAVESFLTKNGDIYELEAAYKKGLLTVNGVPLALPIQ